MDIPRPVVRVDHIAELVRGKRVFDLGALDETALDAKRDSDQWLHGRMCATAAHVVGIDNSAALPETGLETHAGGKILRGDIFDLRPMVEQFGRPDVVVAGELIEHLPDTRAFLRSMAATPELSGAAFVFSTPNACCWHNWFVGLAGRESMHRDHLQVYSYKTLRTVFAGTGIELMQLVPCKARFHEMISSAGPVAKVGVTSFQALVNGLEYLTPALASGWIGLGRIRGG